jgi:hypothetical protein
MVRRSIRWFEGTALSAAVHMLSLTTPHPDVWWTERNRLPDPVRKTVASTFRWSVDEVIHLLQQIKWEKWQRGSRGEDLYMLLLEDPDHANLVARVVPAAMASGAVDAAWTALYLSVYWAGNGGADVLNTLVEQTPAIQALPLFDELAHILQESEYVSLFE